MKHWHLKDVSNGIVNLFFIPLILVTLLGGVPLILANFQGLSSIGVKVVDILGLLLIVVLICSPVRRVISKWLTQAQHMIERYRRPLVCLLIAVTLLWQVAVVWLLSGYSAWDPGKIILAAIGQLPNPSPYFSNYPNTVFLLLLERGIWLVSGQPKLQTFILILNFINIFLIDCGVLMLSAIVKRWFGKQQARFLLVVSWVLIVMAPWIAMPYSDTWAFFLASLCLFLGNCLVNSHRWGYRVILAVGLGLTIILGYYIKPSLIIITIAALIVLVFKAVEQPKKLFNRTVLLSACLVIVGVGAGVLFDHAMIAHQDSVKIDATQAHPLTHFVAMGLHGNGGFNRNDAVMDYFIKSPTARNQANVKLIHQRFRAFNGLTNYEKFLVRKQINNTADGSFAWGQEGQFLLTNKPNNKKLNHTVVRRLFAKHGIVKTNNFEYRFVAQLMWMVVLVALLFTISLSDWKVQLLKYGIVGFMLFLLIFEGGRSRYVIQFLPLVLVLASVGGTRLISQLHQVKFTDRFGSRAKKQDI
mgnify:CR=1 FL=1